MRIPDRGGMADMVPHSPEQLVGCVSNLDAIEGLDRTWVTVWEGQGADVLGAVLARLAEVALSSDHRGASLAVPCSTEVPMRTIALLLPLLALACRSGEVDKPAPEVDADADGYAADVDCDDADPDVFPGADEVCDGVDDDCDGAVDEDAADAETWYRDADRDGHGDAANAVVACEAPEGYAATDDDCDDRDAAFHPGAPEDDCTDPSDYNCDGSVGYADADGDGWAACEECDDGSAAVNPGANEVCNDGVDDDCDGEADGADALGATPWHADADGDTYGDAAAEVVACAAPADHVVDATDCDDTDPTVHPGAAETCDGDDEDCDGMVDEDASDADTWYADADGDSYGAAAYAVEACVAPEGYVADATDCDDGSDQALPGGTEVCDGLDNDCDGTVDVGAGDALTWYADGDGDGYGDAAHPVSACEAPAGYVSDDSDCDDGAATAHPGRVEVCDTLDNDCDGATDEDDAVDAPTWYADGDGDGYGDPASPRDACAAPAGHVADGSDCDDEDGGVHPGAPETCDGEDEDCDGTADELPTDADTWYADVDGDGYGSAASAVEACAAPAGFVADGTDCDDAWAAASPAGTEVCDGHDDDCDGTADEDATDAPTWHPDVDGDGYGALSGGVSACEAPAAYVLDGSDCDDTTAAAHPGRVEVCDTVDNDCDGETDEDDAVGAPVWYADADGDTWGDASVSHAACAPPAGHVARDGDCDDTTSAISPDAPEVCNEGVDDDCDGYADDADPDGVGDTTTWYLDGDGDGFGRATWSAEACVAPAGYVADATDCDDTAGAVHTGAAEVCNGVDDDCDGLVDHADPDGPAASTWYLDADGDGFGVPGTTTTDCRAPAGYDDDALDCDDTDASVHPGAPETCDGADQDCDGFADDGVLGVGSSCAAEDCEAVYATGASVDGLYWIDPGVTGSPWEAWCDLSRDGGGWTRLYSSHYPTWWSPTDWEYVGAADDLDYSVLGDLDLFAEGGVYEFRLEVGNSGDWTSTSTRSHYTVWLQGHDPFWSTTNGSDYTFLAGEEPTTCGGFNGLHDKYYLDYGTHCRTSDVDSTDSSGCWWMQIVPFAQYDTASRYPGYLEGYEGSGNVHTWQTLWVR